MIVALNPPSSRGRGRGVMIGLQRGRESIRKYRKLGKAVYSPFSVIFEIFPVRDKKSENGV